MLRQAAAPAGLVVAGVVVLIAGGDSLATQATAFALIGVACVVAVSLTFLAIGRAEDAERAASKPPEPSPEPEPPPHGEGRPAAKRRRPLPPRRPG